MIFYINEIKKNISFPNTDIRIIKFDFNVLKEEFLKQQDLLRNNSLYDEENLAITHGLINSVDEILSNDNLSNNDILKIKNMIMLAEPNLLQINNSLLDLKTNSFESELLNCISSNNNILEFSIDKNLIIDVITIEDDFEYDSIDSLSKDFQINDFKNLRSKYYDMKMQFLTNECDLEDILKTTLFKNNPQLINSITEEEFLEVFSKHEFITDDGKITASELFQELSMLGNIPEIVNIINDDSDFYILSKDLIEPLLQEDITQLEIEDFDYTQNHNSNIINRI